MKLLSIGYNHVHDETFEINLPNGIDSWLFLLIRTPGIFYYDGKEEIVSGKLFCNFFEWLSSLLQSIQAEIRR